MNPFALSVVGLALLASCCLAAAPPTSTAPPLANPSFEQGDNAPTGWRLEGKGAWETTGHTGNRSASVTGSGKDSGFWRTADYAFAPNALYRVAFWAKAERATGGCAISGPSFANRDFHPSANWERHAFCFVSPAEVAEAFLRFGQWEVAGKVLFDDVELRPTQAVYERFGNIVLGEGEEIDGTRYTFSAPLGGEGANHSRPLASFRAGFNSDRWVFYNGAEVVYRHEIANRRQLAATVEANCHYHQSGTGFIDASTDGQTWTNVARFDKAMVVRAELPKTLFPADTVRIRLRAAGKEADNRNSKPGDFQVMEYRFASTLDAQLGELRGSTAYLDIQNAHPHYPVTILALPSATGEAAGRWTIEHGPLRDRLLELVPRLAWTEFITSVTDEAGDEHVERADVGYIVAAPADYKGADRYTTRLESRPLRAGTNTLALMIVNKADGRVFFSATAERKVSVLHDASYGHLIASEGSCGLWWCESAYKVSRARPLPTAQKKAVEIAAARNEFEAAQLVLRPNAELKNLQIRVAPLVGPAGPLPADQIRIDRVAYLKVTRPTDSAGCPGWWPDPLPPFEPGATLEANLNHPLWITVHVPPDQPAGDYKGAIELSADGWQATVPLHVRVWDFALPKVSRLQTAFGLDPGMIRRFHNLTTDAELRQVLDLYLENFAQHRIAPYSPALLDPFQVDFSTGPWDGGTIDTKDPKEGKQCLRIDDNDPKSSVVAFYAKPIPVDTTKSYQISWWARTAKPSQSYLVTLQQYDAAGHWLSGNNMDFLRTGTDQWKHEGVSIPALGGRPFNPQTKTLRLALRPVPWSETGEATGTARFDRIHLGEVEKRKDPGPQRDGLHGLDLADGIGPNLIGDGGFEETASELKATIDFSAFDRVCEKWLDQAGLNALLVGLQGMGGGTFFSRSPGRIGQFAQGTPEYERLMASQGKQIVDHLKAKGWLEKAYIYWFDEPEKRDYEFVIDGMKLIQRAAPGLTRMLTEQPEAELAGHVDLWCPCVSSVRPEAIAERLKAGDRAWWYLCCGPHAPYIGLFIDHPAVDLRVWAWLSRKWGVTGQLVWTSNYWTSPAAFPDPDIQNPWQDPMSYCSGYDFTPGKIGYWGNGDGRFLYPPSRDPKADEAKRLTGPINSIRWENLRDGVEDYDTFCLLDQLIAQAKAAGRAPDLLPEAQSLALVPDSVIRDDKTYSRDPQPLLQHRRKVAEMIEKLGTVLK